MNAIRLNFINRSNDANNSQIVIFQKNVSTGFDEIAVAWTVIKNCGQGDNHPFTYPMDVTVAAADSWGNFTPQQPASPGQAFDMVLSPSGDVLNLSNTPATDPDEIEIRNQLMMGSISGNCYRAGRLCATKTGIAPGQKAVFSFRPTIWIGVVSEIEEGDILNSAIISEINTEINLMGVGQADIIMTGGGTGPSAQPFRFTLENVQLI